MCLAVFPPGRAKKTITAVKLAANHCEILTIAIFLSPRKSKGLWCFSQRCSCYEESSATGFGALRRRDELAFGQLMIRTQRDVLGRKPKEGDLKSAELGNLLRASCAEARERLSIAFEDILLPIRSEMLKLINASDGDLFCEAH